MGKPRGRMERDGGGIESVWEPGESETTPEQRSSKLQRSAEGVDRSTVEGGEMSARADGLLGLLVGLTIGRVRRYWFVSAFSLFVRDGIRCDGAATRGGCEPQSWAGYSVRTQAG